MKPGISSSVVGDATKSKGSWTPEPWKAEVEPQDDGEIRVVARQPYGGTGSFHVALCNTKADADRIASCVNGCAGLNPVAYRACVEALKVALARLEMETELDGTIHPTVKEEVRQARQALAQAEEKGGKA